MGDGERRRDKKAQRLHGMSLLICMPESRESRIGIGKADYAWPDMQLGAMRLGFSVLTLYALAFLRAHVIDCRRSSKFLLIIPAAHEGEMHA